jgi:hypothetical protein
LVRMLETTFNNRQQAIAQWITMQQL